MHFVIAGHFDQAKDFALRMKWGPKEWHYLGSINTVLGLRGVTVICVGEYWKHSHWRHVEHQHDIENLALEFPDES